LQAGDTYADTYLEWREGSKRVRLSVGKDPADASARRRRKGSRVERGTMASLSSLRMVRTDTGK